MKRTLAFGGLVATAGLLAAGLAVPAQASSDVSSTTLAGTNMAAQQVAAFWYGQAKANLINATPYGVETQAVARHVTSGGPTADTKPGVVPAIGDEKKASSTSKNVNLPRTSGKVFFIGADGRPHWCSATSVQSSYHNLVATAGHCVYDTKSNKTTLDKWVFIPGYYQGKTPWGIYVGKTAYTHYDYDVYEDGDRDYAFVTVYNGVLPTSVDVDHTPSNHRQYETKWDAYKAKKALEGDKTTGWSHVGIQAVPDFRHVVPVGTRDSKKFDIKVDVFKFLNPGKDEKGTGSFKPGTGYDESKINASDYKLDKDSYVSLDGKTLYYRVKATPAAVETPAVDASATPTPSASATAETVAPQQYTYFKRTFWANYDLDYVLTGKVLSIGLKDVGRLGDNVGGQGLAYNQKLGKPVFVFGYPSGSHPDGNYAFTGKTLKWAYGKTFATSVSSIKGDELVGVKSSFTGEGSIGSSWLLNYQSARRLGYLNGVTITTSDTDKNGRIDTSVSPYFDGETYGVYKSAAAGWSGKIV